MPFTYITGSGTQQDPYSIGSIEAWQELVANCSSPNGSELTNSYMCLDTDLDFNDITGFENWSTNPPANLTGPMDSCDYDNRTWVYLREFNGNNHTIRGAYVYQDTNGEWSSWLSLIQVIGDPSIIRNIKFDHCYFYINTGANYDYEDSAGVIINGGYGHDVQYGGAPGRVSNIEVKNSVFNFTGRYYYPALIAADCVDHIYIDNTNTINVGTTMFSCVYCGACASDIYLDPVINVVNNSYTQQFLTLSGVTINDGNIQSLYKYDKNSGKYAKASQPQLVSVGIQDESLSFSRLYIGGTVNIPAMSIANLYVAPFTIHDYYASLDVISECIGAITLNGQNTAVTSKLNLSGLNYYGNGSYARISFEDGQKPLCQMRNCYSVCEYNLSSVPATTNYAGLSVSYTEHNELEIEDSYNMDTVNLGSSFTGNGAVFAALGGSDTSDSHADNCYYVENVPAFTAPQYGTNTELTSQDFAVSSNTGSLDYTSTWELDAVKGRPVLSSTQEGVPAYVDGDLLVSQAAPQPQVETYELILRQNYDNYGTVTGAGNYAEGASVVITATPASGYAFVRWNDGATENPRTIIMPASSITYTAGFGYTLNAVSADDTMGSVTGGGNYCPGEQATITAVPNSGYRFSQWNDDNTENPRHVWADNTTFTATFVQIITHTVTLTSNDANLGSVAGSGVFEHGTQVTLVATPASESIRFNGWSDGETNPTRTVVLTDDLTLTATFEQLYSLTLSSSSGSQCASFVGAGLHSVGEEVSVVAVPASGYRFTSWSDLNTSASRTVVMPAADLALTAAFQSLVEISVSDGTDSITYTSTDGDLTRTGNTYSGWFNTSGSINVTLVPGEDRALSAWSDGETALSRVISTSDPVSLTASTFRDVAVYTLTVGTNDSNLGTATGGGDYDEGTVVEIQATAAQGISFVGWSDGSVLNPRGVTVSSNMTINAIFGYMLQIFQSEYGTVSGEGAYAAGSTAVLTATPVENFYFAEWSDHNTDNPRTVTVDADASYEPVFRMKKTLTVQSSNGANGGVSFSEEGPFENSITTMVVPGTEVTVYTSPAQQYQLSSWSDGGSGATRTITVNDDLAVTAVFSKILRTFYINVEINDSELGDVTGEGYAQEDSYITITAVPRAGARFVGWTDGDMQTTRSILVTGDATYTAMFEEIIYFTVEATSNDPVFGHVDGAGIFEEGSQITLTAVPEEGYAFSAWSDGVLSASRTVALDENKSFHAIFMKLYHRMVNTYRYDGKVGRMKANGKIYSSITLYRSLDLAENACVELGQFDTNTGKHFIFVSVKDATRYILKQYSLSLNHNHTSGEWFRADPLDSSDLASNEFQLEVKSDGVSAALRLKRLTGGDELDFQIVIQNLGIEDESWFEGQEAYIDTTEVPSYIESMPAGLNRCDHMHLANRGDYTHAEIDAHLDAENPHPGHEVISDKNVPNGYAGLDDAANVPLEHLPIGGDDDQLVLGSDPRLSDDRYPTSHAHSHTVDGDDTLYLTDLAGNLVQDRTHNNVDTDTSADAIHHTIGDGPTQAAPGDHLHDERYAPIDQGVLGGNDHIHDGENTAKVDHVNLLNKGIYTHDQIDEHLEAVTPHSGHENKANKDIPNGYAGLNALGKLKSEELPFGIGPGTVCEGNDPRLNDARPPSAHAQQHAASGSDPIDLVDLGGNLSQDRTHDNVDTDSTVNSLHHTIGTGATQAAAGNHMHDERYAPISMLLADNADVGPNFRVANSADTYVLGTVAVEENNETVLRTRFHKLSHNDLSDKGTYDHTDIDQFINDATQYEVTARRGQANGYASLDANGRIPQSQMPVASSSLVPNVANIAARNALTDVVDGVQIRVLDASDDPSVESGWALYTYDAAQSSWSKLAEQESLDMITDWSNIQNGPASTAPDIDTAVGQSHVQNTDQALDYGGNNEVTAAAIKAHLESFTAHAGNEVLSNKGQPDGYAELDSTGRLPASQLPLNIAAATAESATTATSASTAGHATTADSATSADTATTAASALTAGALSSAFELELTGDAVGSVAIDGSMDVTLNVTIPAIAANQFSLMSAEEVEAIIV